MPLNASLKYILEAAIFAYEEPLPLQKMAELFDESDRPNIDEIKSALKELQEDYTERGIELKEVASGYRFQARQILSPYLKKLWNERPAKYSRSFLETLALIAYRQPITRAEIEEIRGVAVNPNVIRSLLERHWIKVLGHRDIPGKPELLGTSKEFLDYFNIKTLSELPTLQEIKNLDITSSETEMHLQLLQQQGELHYEQSSH